MSKRGIFYWISSTNNSFFTSNHITNNFIKFLSLGSKSLNHDFSLRRPYRHHMSYWYGWSYNFVHNYQYGTPVQDMIWDKNMRHAAKKNTGHVGLWRLRKPLRKLVGCNYRNCWGITYMKLEKTFIILYEHNLIS